MNSFPENISFKFAWRSYQKRLLEELKEHLDDRHLHVVAPPGSGKTVLGIEVMLRINHPTLILAPTIAIKNQWVQRFCDLFLQVEKQPDWISKDIKNPKFLTVSTYQGLYAACKNSKEEINEEEVRIDENPNFKKTIASLREQNIETIIVDEAHHLKNSWWKILTEVKATLNPIIIGLTATPPYDVSVAEWHRYLEFNGPIDAEISTPELVAEHDLCPHQDFVYLTYPTPEEYQQILNFRKNVNHTFEEICHGKNLIHAVSTHPIFINPLDRLEWIYSNFDSYAASLIFLNKNEIEIPQTHAKVIGGGDMTLPKFDFDWAAKLLSFFLQTKDEHFSKFKKYQKELTLTLKKNRILQGKTINFHYNKKIVDNLGSSIGKLNAIKEIVEFEHQQLKSALRLVVLTDYIRKEFIPNSDSNDLVLNKMGVATIFEELRRNNFNKTKLGTLTGSFAIIPASAKNDFIKLLDVKNTDDLKIHSLPYDKNYLLIKQNHVLKNKIVHVITQLFESGEIEVLIGTKSLLGEGWDAPAINALILGSFVGSFVTSNQMRGRAIRSQIDNVKKTANIWHLACVDPTSSSGGQDFEMLKRRFKSFVGVSFNEPNNIENGIDRLGISDVFDSQAAVNEHNKNILRVATNREFLKQRWKTALKKGVRTVAEIKIPFHSRKPYPKVVNLYFTRTIAYTLSSLLTGIITFILWRSKILLDAADGLNSTIEIFNLLVFLFGIGLFTFGGFAFWTFKLYLNYRDIAKDIQKIGEALLETLVNAGIIHTHISRLKVAAIVEKNGAVFCHLEGGKTYEKSIFINNLAEVIQSVDNPRYIIIRKNRFLKVIKQRDYHSVPEMLGRNKKIATDFSYHWEILVGKCELVFVRSLEGRRLLLQARMKSLAAQFDQKPEQVQKWR